MVVAAEVAEEVGVLFEDEAFDAGASEEEAEHHAGWAAAYNAAAGWGKEALTGVSMASYFYEEWSFSLGFRRLRSITPLARVLFRKECFRRLHQ